MNKGTRAQIIEIIKKNGKTRPVALAESLGISAQALHRHLRALKETGVLEAHGRAPYTQYALAGVPDFETAFSWSKTPRLSVSPKDTVCESRDQLAARLPRLKSLVQAGVPERSIPLIIAALGEVGNNSFDHNLGQWKDVPGCWLELQITGKLLWACVIDRGQGVFRSLSRFHREIKDDQSALEAAFEKIISGRAPEQRGNGLKFVRNLILSSSGNGIACGSGSGRVQYGDEGPRALNLLEKNLKRIDGTFTLLVWRLP
jgi:hypothetical protein